MPRRHRLFVPGKSVHVMNRGHNRDQIFDEDFDCELFLNAVRKAAMRHEFEVHAFALMKNHFHLLATPQSPDAISKCLKAFQTSYCRYFNRKHERVGSIWNGRYHAVPIESVWQSLVCLRYIELNPVRAGLVEEPAAYR